jgi:DNA-binding NarL/FixJ family response regulator
MVFTHAEQAIMPLGEDAPERESSVLILGDQRMLNEALRRALELSGLCVLGPFSGLTQALIAAERERPDVGVIDLDLTSVPGPEAGQLLRKRADGIKLVGYTRDPRGLPLERLTDYGFRGWLPLQVPLSQFVSAVHVIAAGKTLTPFRAPERKRDEISPEEQHAELAAKQLTRRERQVLALLREGATVEDIGRRLQISPNTARTHIQNVLTKLQVHSRLEAVAFAVRHGIIRHGGGEEAVGWR